VTAAAQREPERRRQRLERPPLAMGGLLGGLEVVVCCGSGGVGKTTVSAALAMSIAAAQDKRVLVLTVDPARRLATALGLRDIGTEPVTISRTRLRAAGLPAKGTVVAAMLDMKSTWDRLIERAAPDRRVAQRILDNPFYQRISEAFIGSQEYAAIEALYELHEAGEYDCLVIDTPPSRNALDFLEAPNRLSDYVGARLLSYLAGGASGFGFRAMNLAAGPFLRLADRLLGGDVLAQVSEFVRELQQLYGGVQKRARDVYRLLRSPRVGFVVVTSLEPGAFEEAEFFATKLREYSMPLRAIVVNRMLPTSLRDTGAAAVAAALVDDPTATAWLSEELGFRVTADVARGIGSTFLTFNALALRDVRQLRGLHRMGDVPVSAIPLFTEEVSQLEGLVRIARLL
jgi:anion-transporting  ArsA/GET3 family ATPase